jgi:hypothetical protein
MDLFCINTHSLKNIIQKKKTRKQLSFYFCQIEVIRTEIEHCKEKKEKKNDQKMLILYKIKRNEIIYFLYLLLSHDRFEKRKENRN